MNTNSTSDIQGHLFLIVGPSGSGKSSLVKYALETIPGLIFPISVTTRAPRPREVDGKDYRFLSPDQFKDLIARNELFEYAHVHGQTYYGMLNREVLTPLYKGKNVIDHIDVQGARNVRNKIPRDHLHIVFIDAGPWEDLQQRITQRAAMSQEEVERRHKSFLQEVGFQGEADIVIKNYDGHLKEAKEDLAAYIKQTIE